MELVEALCTQWQVAAIKVYNDVNPQEGFPSVTAGSKRYDQALSGLRLAARYQVARVITALSETRKVMHNDVSKRAQGPERDNKMAAAETVFLEGALEVLREHRPEFDAQPDGVGEFFSGKGPPLKTSFHWLSSWQPAAESGQQLSVQAEVTSSRSHLLSACAKVVGAMAGISMPRVVKTFTEEITGKVNPDPKNGKPNFDLLRSQVVRLCSPGMRHVALRFDDDTQLKDSSALLMMCRPWQYTAPVKKSQIHHALAEMLTQALWPLVYVDQPRSCSGLDAQLLSVWHETVRTLKVEALEWVTTHAKHQMAGIPFYTVLVCLLDDANYASSLDAALDMLFRVLKGSKEYRAMCVRCLVQLAASYLNRNARAVPRTELKDWLDKMFKVLLNYARKGNLTLHEQLDMVAPIAELAPEYAVPQLLLNGLLNSDSSDCSPRAAAARGGWSGP
ncbi:hypothetical protein FOA52_014207 [Chlamydomonas sp. UWO 241]|nr:hypothetical protein FOA52_014207 [Chlamydomonas sp. UWO 241]